MKLQFIAILPDGWFVPSKDGSAKVKLETPATEFPTVIQLSRFMECYNGGCGKTFRVTIEEDK